MSETTRDTAGRESAGEKARGAVQRKTAAGANRPGAAAGAGGFRTTLDLSPEQSAVLGAAIQRIQRAVQSTDDVQSAAQAGLQGPSGALPHGDAIQRSFGHHDVSGTHAHTDANAAAASAAIGADAFATGDRVAFATPSPSLHTAAHEAAHVVQQRAGVQLSGGVGQVGDRYEQHADAVADRVVSGRSAESLLDQMAPTGGGGAVQRAVQRHGDHEHGAPDVNTAQAQSGQGPQQQPEQGNAPPQQQGETTAPPQPINQPMEAAASRQLLQNAFGRYRTISQGDVRILAQAQFQVAYDAIYGGGQYAWATYVVPNFGNLNGFAHEGVNYINRNVADVTTVPHEMLHNNIASDWRTFVGSPFDEGTTEYLEQYALRTGGIQQNLTHYPNQKACVEAFLASGVSEDQLFRAYFVGGAPQIVGEWVDHHCRGNWSQVKQAMEQAQWATARSLLRQGENTGGGGSWI